MSNRQLFEYVPRVLEDLVDTLLFTPGFEDDETAQQVKEAAHRLRRLMEEWLRDA